MQLYVIIQYIYLIYLIFSGGGGLFKVLTYIHILVFAIISLSVCLSVDGVHVFWGRMVGWLVGWLTGRLVGSRGQLFEGGGYFNIVRTCLIVRTCFLQWSAECKEGEGEGGGWKDGEVEGDWDGRAREIDIEIAYTHFYIFVLIIYKGNITTAQTNAASPTLIFFCC